MLVKHPRKCSPLTREACRIGREIANAVLVKVESSVFMHNWIHYRILRLSFDRGRIWLVIPEKANGNLLLALASLRGKMAEGRSLPAKTRTAGSLCCGRASPSQPRRSGTAGGGGTFSTGRNTLGVFPHFVALECFFIPPPKGLFFLVVQPDVQPGPCSFHDENRGAFLLWKRTGSADSPTP